MGARVRLAFGQLFPEVNNLSENLLSEFFIKKMQDKVSKL